MTQVQADRAGKQGDGELGLGMTREMEVFLKAAAARLCASVFQIAVFDNETQVCGEDIKPQARHSCRILNQVWRSDQDGICWRRKLSCARQCDSDARLGSSSTLGQRLGMTKDAKSESWAVLSRVRNACVSVMAARCASGSLSLSTTLNDDLGTMMAGVSGKFRPRASDWACVRNLSATLHAYIRFPKAQG
ncbi:hypothetical protein K458DRAFT_73737 [Lentithecium fluviatile CBS 122367]|uniref:Uncharacterized protein n=1 Tax=Lentithecium fluviatile CBS 122367 TaxID=1168545 RepID=A0A6G1IVW2_9PLEO|nr:hypothetical protein K458DRAFT_73737 [Lentithecium fluviatile CBS 122367]